MSKYQSILIVEDDVTLASSLAKSFARRDYKVKIAHDINEAKEILKQFFITHAVVDLKLKEDSGLKLVKELHDFNNEMKIVVLTGYASITTTIQAIKSGACYYLAKPANADMIIAAFNDQLESDNAKINAENMSIKTTSIKNLEWEHIHQTLVDTDFNISKAAVILGMHRRTLTRKLAKHGVKS